MFKVDTKCVNFVRRNYVQTVNFLLSYNFDDLIGIFFQIWHKEFSFCLGTNLIPTVSILLMIQIKYIVFTFSLGTILIPAVTILYKVQIWHKEFIFFLG